MSASVCHMAIEVTYTEEIKDCRVSSPVSNFKYSIFCVPNFNGLSGHQGLCVHWHLMVGENL